MMNKEAELIGLRSQLNSERVNLNNFYAENTRLQTDYNTGMSRIQQLERELSDVLYYKGHILEKLQKVESLATGPSSQLSRIQFIRQGQLEGRFLNRIQSRITDQQQKQARAVETIRDNIHEIKNKIQMIEDQLEQERTYVMHVDSLISTNQARIQQKKVQIAKLEGNIRVLA